MMNPGSGRVPGTGGVSSSSCRKVAGAEVVSDQFPAGLRVLVVDDDPTCLMILEKMLRTCLYEVTKCNRAEIALSLLRQNKNGYDIVISDVHMPDMDGFKLLEHVGLEMDLPVIMMSADESKNVVMKGVTHGACDYLIKPVRIEALKNIWQHVVRKRKNEWKELEHSGSIDEQQKTNDDADNNSSSVNEGNWRGSRKRKDEEEETGDDKEDTSTLKKPRVVWSVELHQQFVQAVNQLGVDKAVPKKILELMNVPGLTRENVASHLQKYRIYLRRLGGVSQHQGNLNNSFIDPQDASFGPLSSFNGFDLQALAAAGQLPAQSLAQLQAAGLGRPAVAKPGIPISALVDQRNIFSFENPKLQHLNGCSSNKQMNLLHGIPTGMEPKQRPGLQLMPGGMNMPMVAAARGGQNGQMMMPIGQQPQTRGPMLNDNSGGSIPRLSSSVRQPILPNNVSGRNGIPNNVPGRNGIPNSVSGRTSIPNNVSARNVVPDNTPGVPSAFNSVSQQTSSLVNFPLNQHLELPGNSFPLASTPGMSKGGYQEEVNSSDVKGSSGLVPSYDIFNDLQQHDKTQDWDLHNVGLAAFDAPQGNLGDATSSFSVSEGCSSSTQRNRQDVNAQNMSQHLNPLYRDNLIRVKSERVSDTSCPPTLFTDQYNQDDLMSALLKQQEGMAPAENDFDFDGYSLDNIPV